MIKMGKSSFLTTKEESRRKERNRGQNYRLANFKLSHLFNTWKKYFVGGVTYWFCVAFLCFCLLLITRNSNMPKPWTLTDLCHRTLFSKLF